jgi:hypothetical protein
VNGQAWTPQKNGGVALSLDAYPDWTYVMGFRKRQGWTSADVSPLSITFSANENTELMLVSGSGLSNTSYSRPPETGAAEAAVEYDLGATDAKTNDTAVDSLGEQEWYDVVAGSTSGPIDTRADLERVELAGREPLSLVARPATGNPAEVQYAALRNGGGF